MKYRGNVRELENAIERAFIHCGGGNIGIEHLPEELTARARAREGAGGIRSVRDSVEAQAIRSALARSGFNRAAAARELGIHKTTLFRKLKLLDIVLPDGDGRSRRGEKK